MSGRSDTAARVPLLELRGIGKQFPGVRALDGVDLQLNANEVHMLVGENGAGKSSLIKVLYGAYHADSGSIRTRESRSRSVLPPTRDAWGSR